MRGQSIAGFTVLVAALILWLSQSPVPGWLLAVVVALALPLGIRVSVRQKRMERQFARSVWQTLIKRH